MDHKGSCHCGSIRFEVEGEPGEVVECNCSHCSRKGYLLWFVPRSKVRLAGSQDRWGTYTFNKHVIEHRFCLTCGCAPFGFGKDKNLSVNKAALRCDDKALCKARADAQGGALS